MKITVEAKREQLEKIDKLIIDKIQEWLENDTTERIPELSVALKYLQMNEQVSEKDKQTAGTRHKELLEEAKRKRANEHTK